MVGTILTDAWLRSLKQAYNFWQDQPDNIHFDRSFDFVVVFTQFLIRALLIASRYLERLFFYPRHFDFALGR